jgi:5,10-methylenetetrahydromethanopterin reductase
MKFGLELVPYHRVEKCVKLARGAEAAGIEQLWVCEHYHNRHVYSVLTAVALSTKKIALGPGVTNPYLTHPSLTAAAVATLDEISGGRAMLGISAGDPIFLSTVGIEQKKPVTTVREAVLIIKKLLRGEEVHFQGEVFSCRGARLRFKPAGKIPIYIGGRRRRMLQLAAELADGALLNASHPDDVKECLGYLGKSKLEKVAYVPVSLGGDRESEGKAARGVVAFITSSSPPESLERHGIDLRRVEEIRSCLLRGKLQEAREKVDERMLEAFSVCGREKLEERIEELSELGITRIVLGSPLGPDPFYSLKVLRSVTSSHKES